AASRKQSPAQPLAQLFEATPDGIFRCWIGSAVIQARAVDRLQHRAAKLTAGGGEGQLVVRRAVEQDQPGVAGVARAQPTAAPGQPFGRGHGHRSGHSGSGLPFVSGRKGRTTIPSRKTLHIASPAYRCGSAKPFSLVNTTFVSTPRASG